MREPETVPTMDLSLRLVHKKRREDPVRLQPYMQLKEGLPETRRTTRTAMGRTEPMTPHKATLAKERKPTLRNKAPPIKP